MSACARACVCVRALLDCLLALLACATHTCHRTKCTQGVLIEGVLIRGALYLSDVESLDVSDGMHGEEAGEWHREVIAEAQQLPTLVSEIVDQFAILERREGDTT